MKPNKEQEKAINTIQGPVILVSCPGSGKTTTLLRRILHMINTGVNPSQILMITFTKAAATEMQKKYTNFSGPCGVTFSTIHSLCLRILFNFGGYTMDNIMKESDAKFFITNLARKDFRINDPMKAANFFFTAYTEYEESEDDYDPYNDGDYSVEDDFDEEAYYDDEEDSLESKRNDKTDDFAPAPHFDNTKHCVDGNTQEDISHKSENKIYKHSPRDNEGSSGKTKQLIMSDSTWWFNRMAENQTMADSEVIYVDTMVSLMQQFYFSSLKKRLDEKSLSENIISDLRKIYESLSELFE